MEKALQKAKSYILEQEGTVVTDYKPYLHFSARIGWINDPNGFCFDGENYHLFYQYYPYDSKWGPMHWGHASSKDLLSWTHLPVALAPSEPYDQSGIFSGTAILDKNKMSLYYTGHVDVNGVVEQCQCLATSFDKIKFTKHDKNPLITKQSMPEDSVFEDFRDPKILIRKGRYLMLTGSRTKEHLGQILIHSSTDGLSFKYENRMVFPRKYGDVVECPDLLTIDGQDVLIFSTQKAELNEHVQNSFSVFAWIGSFDDRSFVFNKQNEQVLDYGFDFYAPETSFNGHTHSLIAWMNSWERDQITDLLKHGWAGSMSIPRTLSLKSNVLHQALPQSLDENLKRTSYHEKLWIHQNEMLEYSLQKISLIKFNIDLSDEMLFKLEVFKTGDESFDIIFDGKKSCVTIDRSKAKYKIKSKLNENQITRKMMIGRKLECAMLVDHSCIELIVNGFSMSSLYYGSIDQSKLCLSSTNQIQVMNFSISD